MFIQEKHADLNDALIEKETNRLWGMAKSRLCDQPITPWREILEFKARGGLVVVISSRRAYVAALKPALRKQGFIVTFGQPGDAMTGLRTIDPNTWVLPWMAKTIGAISCLLYTHYKFTSEHQELQVKVVYMAAAMGTGSQSEWERLEELQSKIHQETPDIPFSLGHAVVDSIELVHSYGLNIAQLEREYYNDCKRVWFIRHGNSNLMLNSHLTYIGMQQALDLGQKHNFHVETVAVSPHISCLQTCQYLKITANHLLISSTFAELNRSGGPSELSSDSWSWLSGCMGSMPMAYSTENFPEEQEMSNEELKQRVLARMQMLPGTDIVIVTHRVLIQELTSKDIDNCQVVECNLEHGSIENVTVWR